MKKLLITLCFGLWVNCYSQHGELVLPEQNPDSIRIELQELFKELSIKHPGFYRYNEKEAFDKHIDSTISTIQEPITELEIYRKVKPLIAKIGCLHTGIHLSEESEQELDSQANCLAFTLFYDDGKAVVWKSFDQNSPLEIGDEVSKINGQGIQEIYDLLLKNIPMDGYNTTGKYKLLQYSFPVWYRNIIEVTDEFEIELADGSKHSIQAVKKDKTLDHSDIIKQPMSLEIIEDIAVIRIPSFANSYLDSHNQTFKKEIQAFQSNIEENAGKTILLDLRGNTGGSDSNPALLSSYFFDKPYRYWDRIEVTEAVAQDVSGLTSMFYGKPKYEDGKWLWSDKGLSSKEFKFTREQDPSRKQFEGDIYILTDGLCFSSCADFVAIMQAGNKAIVIGEETGGGYQGNTSGIIPSEQLPCGLIIDVPLLKYVNSVPSDTNLGRGSMPDMELNPRFEELDDDQAFLLRVIEAMENDIDNE